MLKIGIKKITITTTFKSLSHIRNLMDEPDDFSNPEDKEPSKQDKMIADEEKEIQKIIEEGERAAKKAEGQKIYHEEPATESKPGENKGLWKWFLVGVVVVFAIGIIFIGMKYANIIKIGDLQHTGPLAVYDPAEFLSGWKLKSSYVTLADLPLEKKQEFFDIKNLTDVATWEFAKGGDTIFVWLREFADEDATKIGAESFGVFAWRPEVSIANLPFGDEGKIGVYRVTGHDPLMTYVMQDDKILSIAYYNTKNAEYDATKLSEDKIFLTSLTRKVMRNIVSIDGKELAIPHINT